MASNRAGWLQQRAFFLIDQEGIVRGRWLPEKQAELFPSDPIIERVREITESARGRYDRSRAGCRRGGNTGKGDMRWLRGRGKLTNAVDQALVRRGLLQPEQVRTYEADALGIQGLCAVCYHCMSSSAWAWKWLGSAWRIRRRSA